MHNSSQQCFAVFGESTLALHQFTVIYKNTALQIGLGATFGVLKRHEMKGKHGRDSHLFILEVTSFVSQCSKAWCI
jgi:hypothetical protein